MGSLLTKTERGRPVRMLQVLVPGVGRETLRLGSLPPRAAERFRDKVEALAACRRLNQTPDPEVVAWLVGLSNDAYRGLAHAGLVDPREPLVNVPTLGAFLDKYIAGKVGGVSARSVELLEQTAGRLKAHFEPQTPLDHITPDGAADWRGEMLSDGLSEATTRLHTRNAKSIFNAAVERELRVNRGPCRGLRRSAPLVS